MLKLLYNLFIGNLCKHKWAILGNPTTWEDEFGAGGALFYLRCEKCGNIKKTKG